MSLFIADLTPPNLPSSIITRLLTITPGPDGPPGEQGDPGFRGPPGISGGAVNFPFIRSSLLTPLIRGFPYTLRFSGEQTKANKLLFVPVIFPRNTKIQTLWVNVTTSGTAVFYANFYTNGKTSAGYDVPYIPILTTPYTITLNTTGTKSSNSVIFNAVPHTVYWFAYSFTSDNAYVTALQNSGIGLGVLEDNSPIKALALTKTAPEDMTFPSPVNPDLLAPSTSAYMHNTAICFQEELP